MEGNKRKRVLVGMSGGVDSSVAALLLKRQGYEVIGVTMKITPEKGQRPEGSSGLGQRGRLKEGVTPAGNKTSQSPPVERSSAPGLQSPPSSSITGDDSANKISRAGRRLSCFGDDSEEEVKEAEAVARHIGIPFQVVDLSREYEERILSYFRSEYARGRTPNPCVRCNAEIKFGLLLEGCRKLGLDYDYFATGHYARVRFEARTGRWLLLKAREVAKDQSYFLSLLSQEQLGRTLFPLGELSKVEVRKIARENNLPLSEKEESQDFYAGDYRELLGPGKPGYIKDLSGRVLGKHDGIENFTIGQRRGLGVSSTGRLYVVKIEPETGTVYVGEEKDLLTQRFRVEKVNWIARVPEAGEELEATVRVRYKSPELNCRIVTGAAWKVRTEEAGAGKAGAGRADVDFAGGGNKADSAGKGQRARRADTVDAAGRVAEAFRITEGAESAPVEAKALVEALSEVEAVLLSPYKAITPGQVAVFYDGEAVLGAGFIS
ncbi:MAG: tRNA 2-thiouridine(34) synthase MnmA [Candidatus Aminicenantes bacterium]|nr:tRNA 2-thiouridine(34) synthase MnmA [Candidatus Aminicenantes bacterium]